MKKIAYRIDRRTNMDRRSWRAAFFETSALFDGKSPFCVFESRLLCAWTYRQRMLFIL